MSVITCPGCMHTELDLPQTCIGQRVRVSKCEIDFEATQPEAKLALDADPPLAVEPPKQAAARRSTALFGKQRCRLRSAAAPMMFCIECGTKFAAGSKAGALPVGYRSMR